MRLLVLCAVICLISSCEFEKSEDDIDITEGDINTNVYVATLSICGNGIVEQSEQCDGRNLRNITCQSLGFDKGIPSCSSSCRLDTTNCQWNDAISTSVPTSSPTPAPAPSPQYKIFPGQTKAQLVTLFGPPVYVGTYPSLYYTWGGNEKVCMTNDIVSGCTSTWGFDCDPSLWDKC